MNTKTLINKIELMEQEINELKCQKVQTRKSNFLDSHLSKRLFISLIVLAIIIGGSYAIGAISVPHTFSEGETISASEHNENFTALVNQINTNTTVIASNSTNFTNSLNAWQDSADNVLTTSSTTWTDTDMSITATTSNSNVLLMFSGSIVSAVGTAVGFVFNIDGTDVTTAPLGNQVIQLDTSAYEQTVSFQWLANVAAGSHTFKVRWIVPGGASVSLSDGGNFSRQFQVIELK